MQEQIQKAMDKGVEVFGQMREIRNEEITDKGVDFFDRMTDEEYAAYQLQDEVGDRAYDISSGLSTLHTTPRTLRRYLSLKSRLTRFHSR